ncbi:FG-GAP repeat domain-containing protein [Streptomyces zaomyceticus]|uniref:FG-GAP repeat domain-containing protein n=1 Tax=Streptomyces zaomyceticus TaxID=68286 RepID=UPI0034360FA6
MPGILVSNTESGEAHVWYADGTKIVDRKRVLDADGLVVSVNGPWKIVATGTDAGAFTRPNIIWHDANSHMTLLWRMFNYRLSSTATVVDEAGNPIFVGPPWETVGCGDFNGDGKADILWHDNSTGGGTDETQIWFIDGHRITSRATVVDEAGNPIFVGPPWETVGCGDFNGDGKADILWHDNSTGGGTDETQIWFIDGHRITSRATVVDEAGNPIFVGLPWHVVGVGDFNGDGKADILWHDHAPDGGGSHELQIWFMDGHRITSRAAVLAENGNPVVVEPPWRIEAVGEFTHHRVGPVTAEGSPAGTFRGDVVVTGKMEVSGGIVVPHGDISVSGDLILTGADVAEQFDVADHANTADGIGPGTVVVLDADGAIAPCTAAYDTRVAGVVSGAGDRVPALLLDRGAPGREAEDDRRPVAVTGKAWCRAEALDHPIKVGDLLTTSSVRGHARKATDRTDALGAVIGKALTQLHRGTGTVLVLVGLA